MKRAIAAALALSLLGGTAAMAQPAQYQRDHQGQYHQGYQNDRYDDRYEDRRDDRRDSRYDRRDDRRGYGYGYGQQRHRSAHAWHRGERLPSYYRSSNYYVSDYGRYGLRAPPRGHRWVRADNDYVLAAIATGLIVQVLSNGYGR
ncbi:MAG: RcnB family protein [Phenylobacterium sp.]|uniref:RcnB family protein n=1 Tax=Phenylobacterium sp. TaxID=1871053 RepID=UPI001B4FF7E6|nr:RcnB family protein [Phenylobacterium sp.]MBP7649454.1 RcnB family protein [Phenylobacterium sp.]MBP7814925.1 RcnB family protein [Phenylobacterium sp.]MBP9231137.1 RcnB family protein [Phenylobacterium sp.]MBP9753736.1 RcnB family protein [Phenylobacterium sp.]